MKLWKLQSEDWWVNCSLVNVCVQLFLQKRLSSIESGDLGRSHRDISTPLTIYSPFETFYRGKFYTFTEDTDTKKVQYLKG